MRFNIGINTLIGKTVTDIKKNDNTLLFTCSDGTKYKMHHDQDCCEDVYIDDICGDLNDLIGSEIIKAEESTNTDLSPMHFGTVAAEHYDESHTWTFYHIATIKGYVTIRWFGTSNGYYSESVDFDEISEPLIEKDERE